MYIYIHINIYKRKKNCRRLLIVLIESTKLSANRTINVGISRPNIYTLKMSSPV